MIRHLVLLGAGPGHQRFLLSLQKKRHNDIAITLITRQELHIETAQLLRAIAGQLPLANCGELIEPLLHSANVNWLDQNVQAIDASAKVLLLDDARELRFDWLSIDLEPAQNRDLADRQLPGARANGMFVRPREAFCKLWPRVAELAATQPLRVAVVCSSAALERSSGSGNATTNTDVTAPMPLDGDAALSPSPAPTPATSLTPASPALDWQHEKFAIELAFAVRQAFTASAVTLITGGQPIAAQASPALRTCIQSALRKHRITVLVDTASAIQAGEIVLQSGAHLACDVPLLALQAPAHPLLAQSGLTLNGTGHVDVDGGQRSRSHAYVFASDGVDAVDARSRILAASLQAVIDGKQPAMFRQPAAAQSPARFQTLRADNHQAIVTWRGWALSTWRFGPAMLRGI